MKAHTKRIENIGRLLDEAIINQKTKSQYINMTEVDLNAINQDTISRLLQSDSIKKYPRMYELVKQFSIQ